MIRGGRLAAYVGTVHGKEMVDSTNVHVPCSLLQSTTEYYVDDDYVLCMDISFVLLFLYIGVTGHKRI